MTESSNWKSDRIDVYDSNKSNAFQNALSAAPRGAEIVYHVGAFAGGKFSREAMAAYQGGFALLVQRRKGPYDFEYIAKRTKKKMKKVKL